MSKPILRIALILLLVAPLFGFRPFTPVKDVCPTCNKPKSDIVVLLSGAGVPCKIVGQNDDYYLLEWLGESRAIRKDQVASIKHDGPPAPPAGDTVVLNSGVALRGKIRNVEAGRYIAIEINGKRHIAWLSQIEAAYQDGKKLSATPPTP